MHSAKKTYDGKIAGLYDLEETLGRGHFAVVKLARHVFTGEKVAVKVIDKTKLDDVSKAHLFQEVRCMKLVQHPNVVRLYEVIDTQTKLYLILELGDGGDLYDYIMKHEAGLGEDMAREYFRQIVRAISYCHQLHVVHRDLKPENVVFFERLGVVKLTDFGFSNKFCPGQKLETSCGSLAYSAPEILLGDSYDAPAVDVWSLGVILYMLVVGQAPFQEANDSETLTMIMDCKYTIPTHVSDACKRLIARMLVREPELRANLADIASDPWLGGPPQVEYLPLVSRHQVTEEDHNIIINKMVNGNIATKEEVLEALDKNEYNHITATYFLLAERKLRSHRQEQAQTRVKQNQILINITTSSNNSVRTDPSDSVGMDTLQFPSPAVLNVPRTPGDAPQGRTRKCSIVQEEEEEEYSNVGDERELTPPHSSLNRRGSRSEGKLNIAIQERLAEERRKEKKESPNGSPLPVTTGRLPAKDDATCWPAKRSSPTASHPGISSTYIPGSTKWRMGKNKKSPVRNTSLELNLVQNKCATENRLEQTDSNSVLGKSPNQISMYRMRESNTADSKPKEKNTEVITSSPIRPTAKLIPTKSLLVGENTEISTILLSDSATVTIPVRPNQIETVAYPKFKTMPSPTHPSQKIITTTHLNETNRETIPELHKSIGGDIRSNGMSITGMSFEQRRKKFHKARTASCSSSDASDDDSESRKKRAQKLSSEKNNQRRDSHDDSSDSQDRGGGGGEGGAGANLNLGSSGNEMYNQNHSSRNQENRSAGGGDGSDSSNNRRQCNGENFRRSRRRTAETRLRESQSLNRITEVQESEGHVAVSANEIVHNRLKKKESEDCFNRDNISNNNSNNFNNINNNNFDNNNKNVDDSKIIHGHSNKNNINNNNVNNSNNYDNDCSNIVSSQEKSKSVKSLGARFLQSWSNTISSTKLSVNRRKCVADERSSHGNNNRGSTSLDDHVPKQYSDEKENKILLEKSEKKGKLLGKYFQVSKKLCLPLPNIMSKGRLYKARSCGSIPKDKMVSSLSAGPSDEKQALTRRQNLDMCKSSNTIMNQSLDSIDVECNGDLKKLNKKSPVIPSGSSGDNNMCDISTDIKNSRCGVQKKICNREGSKCPIVGLCKMHMKDAAKCHLS